MQQPSPIYGAPVAQYAGFLPRFGAYLIDGLIISVVDFILFAIVGVMIGLMSRSNSAGAVAGILIVLVYGAIICITLGYFSYFESSEKQATFGKQAIGLKVITVDGNRLTFMHALGRTLAKIFGMMLCYAGPLAVLFTEKKQGLHDMVANTLVVTTK
jgi:uncharacterized RDD family membrane protein YckC